MKIRPYGKCFPNALLTSHFSLNILRAIVLTKTRYADDSFIVNLYTEDNGPVAVSVKTSRRGKVRLCHLEPLTLLDVALFGKASSQIKTISDCQLSCSLSSGTDPSKWLIAQFVAEVLGRLSSNLPVDGRLFSFLYTSVEKLASLNRGAANFHLFFLIKLTYFLGISPNIDDLDIATHFDLTEGRFVDVEPLHGFCLTHSDSVDFANMLRTSYDSMYLWHMTRDDRNRTLDHIIDYYRLQSFDLSRLQSLDVLRAF